MTEVVQEEQCL